MIGEQKGNVAHSRIAATAPPAQTQVSLLSNDPPSRQTPPSLLLPSESLTRAKDKSGETRRMRETREKERPRRRCQELVHGVVRRQIPGTLTLAAGSASNTAPARVRRGTSPRPQVGGQPPPPARPEYASRAAPSHSRGRGTGRPVMSWPAATLRARTGTHTGILSGLGDQPGKRSRGKETGEGEGGRPPPSPDVLVLLSRFLSPFSSPRLLLQLYRPPLDLRQGTGKTRRERTRTVQRRSEGRLERRAVPSRPVMMRDTVPPSGTPSSRRDLASEHG